MRDFEVILALLFVSTIVQPVARRLDVPLAIAQVVCGLVLATLPVVAHVALDPELTFALFVPPLLFWAAAEGDKPDLSEIATRHVEQLRDHILRPDDTTYHTFYWDPTTGAPLRGETEQGNADDSCWARGQAWGIYGFALNHRHTGDPSFLHAARRCADHFLAHLPADGVAYWDLEFGDGSGEPRDSSAAAIAVCGLLTLGGDRYREAALRILGSLMTGYVSPGSNALLVHGVYDKPKGVGVDEGNLWGDYFYLEALTRIARPDWIDPW